LIHSSADGHLDCFCALAIVNRAAVNTEVHASLWNILTHFHASTHLTNIGLGYRAYFIWWDVEEESVSVMNQGKFPPDFLSFLPTSWGRHILDRHSFLHMAYEKDFSTCLQNRNRSKDIEENKWIPRGKQEWVELTGWGWHIYTIDSKHKITNENLLYSSGNST